MLSFFPRDVLDEIWDLIGSVSEGFQTFFCISELLCLCCVETLKNRPLHSFNALVIPILRGCLPNYLLVLAVPRRLFCFGSLVILDVVCRYLSLFVLYINIKVGKNSCLMLD